MCKIQTFPSALLCRPSSKLLSLSIGFHENDFNLHILSSGEIFHVIFGLQAPSLSHPYLRLVMSGIENSPAGLVEPKEPFCASDLPKLLKVVCLDVDVHLLTWIATVLMFNSLLRISHIVLSPHTLLQEDVKIQEWGVLLRIRSAKTLKHGSKPVMLPLVKRINSNVCPVKWLMYLLMVHPKKSTDPLFSTKKLPKFTYPMFNRVFKILCSNAGISGNYSSHSLRRGGATLLANAGVCRDDIKIKGMWSSDAVNRYIVPSLSHKVQIDKVFADLCA